MLDSPCFLQWMLVLEFIVGRQGRALCIVAHCKEAQAGRAGGGWGWEKRRGGPLAKDASRCIRLSRVSHADMTYCTPGRLYASLSVPFPEDVGVNGGCKSVEVSLMRVNKDNSVL